MSSVTSWGVAEEGVEKRERMGWRRGIRVGMQPVVMPAEASIMLHVVGGRIVPGEWLVWMGKLVGVKGGMYRRSLMFCRRIIL